MKPLALLIVSALSVSGPAFAQSKEAEIPTLSMPQDLTFDAARPLIEAGTQFEFSMSDGSTQLVATTPSSGDESQIDALMAKADEVVLGMLKEGDTEGAKQLIEFASGDAVGWDRLRQNSDNIIMALLNAGEISNATIFRDAVRE